ncbi:MAG TPA: sialidase family protein, partial [Bacteroidia bacterium]|nr:sialidase family protein [Bacteroidia bacterium]
MKKILLNFCVFFAVVGLAFAFHQFRNKTAVRSQSNNEGSEDIEGYLKWEQQRLADPATGRIPDNIRSIELGYAAGLPNDLQDTRRRDVNSSVTWQMRGPWNVGGRTRGFAADVKSEATLLAGTTSGGMWRSTDSGKTWALTTQLAIQQSISCLAQDTRITNNHSNVWYYGSGECYGASASATGAYFCGNGVYRSLDNGVTWTSLASTAANNFEYVNNWEGIWSIATDPTAPDSLSIVYASLLNGGIFRSVDTGRTWTAIFGSSTSGSGYYTNIIVTSTGVVYATISSDGSQRGIWRSVDGIHFTNITPPNFPLTYNRIVMNYAPADPNQLYFLANTPGYGSSDTNFLHQVEWNSLWKYKYLSGDGDSAGGAWTDLSANLPHTGGTFDKYNCQGSYDMVVSFLPTDTSTVFIGGTDIFRSTSGFFDYSHTAHIGGYAVGASIPNITVYPGQHSDEHVLFFSKSNPYIMYNGGDGG